MKRITEYTNIETVSESDVLPIVDVSDTEQASTGSTRKGTIEKIADYLKARVETLTNKTLTSPKINEDVTTTATSSELNKLDGTDAITADFDKLHDITATAMELNQLDDVEVGGTTTGDIVTIDDTQTLTGKTINSSNNTNVPSNPYRARAYLGTAQSIPTDGTTTKVLLKSESYDPNNNFDSTTNCDYTVPITGYYHLSGSVRYNGPVADKVFSVLIQADGTSVCLSIGHTSSTGSSSVHTSTVAYLTVGQKITLATNNNFGGVDSAINVSAANTYLSVCLLSL